MMKKDVVDTLLCIGIPASIKGFTYICDAMEIFDTDSYYTDGKVCALYHEIARRRDTTSSRVERAMRRAFEIAITKGDPKKVEKYLDTVNTQNSNLLRTLYIRIKQEETPALTPRYLCGVENCDIKKQIYQEMLIWFSKELEYALEKLSAARK